MKRLLAIVLLSFCYVVLPVAKSTAQDPITEVIKQGIKKVIKAVDLKIQRLQNKTIWLQNAQKLMENKMSQLKLKEISGWAQKQRTLYAKYFDELWRVKAALANYHRTRGIIEKQLQVVKEYKASWALFKQDRNFTGEELDFIWQVYNGILEVGLKNIDQLSLVMSAFSTQMTDAKRLETINMVDDKLTENLSDLREFNSQNKMLSLQRASAKGEIELVKKLYGL